MESLKWLLILLLLLLCRQQRIGYKVIDRTGN